MARTSTSPSAAYRDALFHPTHVPVTVPEELLTDRDETTGTIIQLAIDIHRTLGRGHAPETYRNALAHELACQDYHIVMDEAVPIYYREFLVGQGRVDLKVAEYCMISVCTDGEPLAANRRIRELKSMLQAGGYKVGLVLDFGHQRMMDGIKRVFHSGSSNFRKKY